ASLETHCRQSDPTCSCDPPDGQKALAPENSPACKPRARCQSGYWASSAPQWRGGGGKRTTVPSGWHSPCDRTLGLGSWVCAAAHDRKLAAPAHERWGGPLTRTGAQPGKLLR